MGTSWPRCSGRFPPPSPEQLERAARFEPGDSDADKLDKLESVLADGSRDAQAAASLLAPLLSIASDGRYPRLDMSPERQKEQTLETLVAQMEGLSRRPLLFAFEDAHWADPTSLELLELTVSRVQSLPVLVVITFRPEFLPPWTGYTHVTSLTSNRFSRSLAAAMVDKVTGGKPGPRAVPPSRGGAGAVRDRVGAVALLRHQREPGAGARPRARAPCDRGREREPRLPVPGPPRPRQNPALARRARDGPGRDGPAGVQTSSHS